MENLITTLLVIATLILLSRFKIGASRKKTIVLSNVNLQQFEALLFDFCQKENWRITGKETLSPIGFVYLLNVGVWGSKISGAQEVKLNIFVVDSSLKIEALSRSLMGQGIDWGANKKNLEKLSNFLLSTQSQASQKRVEISEEFIQKQAELQKQEQKTSLLAIIFLCWVPIVGIFYMWLKTSWSKKAKIGFTFFIVIFYTIAFLMIANALIQLQKTREITSPQNIRDFQRKADEGSLQALLQIYFIHHNTYPSSLEALEELAPQYTSKIPRDPGTNIYYNYQLLNDGKDYRICIDFEKKPQECVTSAFEPF